MYLTDEATLAATRYIFQPYRRSSGGIANGRPGGLGFLDQYTRRLEIVAGVCRLRSSVSSARWRMLGLSRVFSG